MSSLGVPRHVGQRLAGNRQQIGNNGEGQVRRLITADLDLGRRVAPQLIGKRIETVDQAARVQQQGLQTEDEVPDVAYYVMQRVDGLCPRGVRLRQALP